MRIFLKLKYINYYFFIVKIIFRLIYVIHIFRYEALFVPLASIIIVK